MIDNNKSMSVFTLLGVILMSMGLLFSSCSGDSMQPSTSTDALLPIKDTTEVNPLGDTFMVAYTSATDWTVELSGPGRDGVSVAPGKGKRGTNVVKVIVNPNATRESREVKIDFGSESFTVTQDPAMLEVVDKIDCGWKGEEKSLEVETNICFKLEMQYKRDTDWLEVATGEYKDCRNVPIAIKFKENNIDDTDNLATVRLVPFKLDNNGKECRLDDIYLEALTKEVAINQPHLEFNVCNAPVAFSEFGSLTDYEADGNPNIQTVTVQSETQWYVADHPDWVKYSLEDKGEGGKLSNTELTLTVEGVNPGIGNRKGNIRLEASEDKNAFREIYVEQNGYTWDVYLEDENEERISRMPVDTTGKATLVIKTKGPWEITGKPEWLEFGEGALSGEGNGKVTLSSPVWNLGERELRETISLNISINEDLVNAGKANVAVVKNPFIFKVAENPVADESYEPLYKVLKSLPMKNVKTYSLQVESSGEWELKPFESDWFSAIKTDENWYQVGAMTANRDKENARSVTLTFCSKVHENHNTKLEKEIEVTQQKYLFNLLSSAEINDVPAYMKNGITSAAEFECSSDWRIKSLNGVEVVSTRPSGSIYALDLGVQANLTETSQSKSIVIESYIAAEGNKPEEIIETKTIRINQDPFIFLVNTEEVPTGTLPYNADGAYTVSVESNTDADWEVKGISENTWVSTTKTSGSSGGNVTFKVSPNGNISPNPRTLSGQIRNTVNDKVFHLNFKQEAYLFSVSGTASEFNELSASPVTYKVKCSDNWSIKGANGAAMPDWLTVSPMTKPDNAGKGETDITVSVKDNYSTTSTGRSFTFYIDGTYANVTNQKEITVTQKPYIFNVSNQSITLPDNKECEKSITIKSSGTWTSTVSGDTGVVNNFPDKGNASRDGKTETLKINTNYTPNQRTAEIKISSDHIGKNSQLTKTITITQPKYEFEVKSNVSLTNRQWNIEAVETSGEFEVTCSGEWKNDDPEYTGTDKDWLFAVKSDNKVEITALANTKTSSRKATVTFRTTDSSATNGVTPYTITVEQKGKSANN